MTFCVTSPTTHIHNVLTKHYRDQCPSGDKVKIEFKISIDTSLPLEKYFERQQLCQGLLKDAKTTTCKVSMKLTTLEHLQKIPHMM